MFDTETTGIRPSEGDELIAIGAVRIVNRQILTSETFERLINPGRSIPAASVRIHGITEDMARDKPPARIVLPQFKNFVGDWLSLPGMPPSICALELKQDECRFDNPGSRCAPAFHLCVAEPIDHSLMATAERLGVVVTGRHTALGDAMATAAIWMLLDLLEARGIRPWVRPSRFRAVWSPSAGSLRSSDRYGRHPGNDHDGQNRGNEPCPDPDSRTSGWWRYSCSGCFSSHRRSSASSIRLTAFSASQPLPLSVCAAWTLLIVLVTLAIESSDADDGSARMVEPPLGGSEATSDRTGA